MFTVFDQVNVHSLVFVQLEYLRREASGMWSFSVDYLERWGGLAFLLSVRRKARLEAVAAERGTTVTARCGPSRQVGKVPKWNHVAIVFSRVNVSPLSLFKESNSIQ